MIYILWVFGDTSLLKALNFELWGSYLCCWVSGTEVPCSEIWIERSMRALILVCFTLGMFVTYWFAFVVKLSVAVRSPSEEDVKGQKKAEGNLIGSWNINFYKNMRPYVFVGKKKKWGEWKGWSCLLGPVLRVTNERIHGLVLLNFVLRSQALSGCHDQSFFFFFLEGLKYFFISSSRSSSL